MILTVILGGPKIFLLPMHYMKLKNYFLEHGDSQDFLGAFQGTGM